MKLSRRSAGLIVAALLGASGVVSAQEVRRAQPLNEPPVPRALPVDEGTPAPEERPSTPEQPSDTRQLEYANALFARKMYDLAIPEYEKYLSDYPGASGRGNAYFGLGESYRQLGKNGSARTNFQKVLEDFGDSEFAGPAAYALAVLAFSQKDFNAAQSLFHKAAAKSKDASVALSAKYFEARCLENTKRADDALMLYLEVAATEAEKATTRTEAAVRAGLIALDLAVADRAKIDRAMAEKARALLQKGRADSGKWKGIAQSGLLRLEYQTGQFAQVVSDYKKSAAQLPDEAKPEAMLLVANAQRQLGHTQEAEGAYREIIEKFPNREEAKDARYQRLINIYNSDPNAVIAEVDEFLKTNPASERADQAKLLKAEALYKQQKFGEAAPFYEELRASQLSPKLRSEAGYKLGWCAVQMKDPARAIDAFSYFIKTFPDDPQTPIALTQRALAYQQSNNAEAAIGDLSFLIANYPKAKEREAAIQQKALLLGEQNREPEMAQTFQQLLKEYPKSSAVAQANYYIGKAAFDGKDYKRAITFLDTSRRLNREQYYMPATLRIILGRYYQHDRKATTSEVDAFLAASSNASIPAEVMEWLGIEYYNDKNYPLAEKYLAVLSRVENVSGVKPDFWFYLGDVAGKLKHYDQAENAYSRYLQSSTDAAGKAKALLALGATKIAAHKPDDAEKIAAEIMTLQPEGKVNAEARLLEGDVQFERQRFEEAGKAYAGVALLYDDPAITPRALDKAADAYRRAGKTEEAARVAKQLRDRYPNYVPLAKS